MSNIESVPAREPRVPAGCLHGRAGEHQAGRFRRDEREGRGAISKGSGATRARHGRLAQAVHAGPRRVERAVLQVVRRRQAQRVVQLPRAQPRERQRRQGRDHLRGRRRRGDEGHLSGALSPRLPARQRPEVARHQEGRPRASSTCRCRSRAWSRCRPARGSARRIRSCSAGSPRSRCRSGSSTPARRRSSPPTSRCAAARAADQGHRRRGDRHGRLRGNPQRRRLPAHRQQGRLGGRSATSGCTSSSRSRPTPASPSGSTPSIRCSSSTRRARPASRRACSTRPAATCCGRC